MTSMTLDLTTDPLGQSSGGHTTETAVATSTNLGHGQGHDQGQGLGAGTGTVSCMVYRVMFCILASGHSLISELTLLIIANPLFKLQKQHVM